MTLDQFLPGAPGVNHGDLGAQGDLQGKEKAIASKGPRQMCP